MSKHPIPDAALDDRLAFLGTAGSGKTYNAGGAVERVLARKGRVVIVDPLDVWWGLRLDKDGKKASPHDVAIFGGRHGDLPLTENAGALIGETVAGMAESCIISLGGFSSSAADRRFMLAFLDTIYRKANNEPFHLVVDEADLFAPQNPPKGDEMLLNKMEQIVRRGRIKGFIPWLITQRPAVLNKNVLSQADGLIALKLTSSQDRDAIGAWIEGQADKQQGKAILGSLPTMQRGQGVVWIPGRSILSTVTFPEKTTFDSSRTPKRGEKLKKTKALKPLNIDALKDKLQAVEAETKENDPSALKKRIRELETTIAKTKSVPALDPKAIKAAAEDGYSRGVTSAVAVFQKFHDATKRRMEDQARAFNIKVFSDAFADNVKDLKHALKSGPPTVVHPVTAPTVRRPEAIAQKPSPVAGADGTLSPRHLKILNAIAYWQSIGFETPTRAQIAFVSRQSPRSSGFEKTLGNLNVSGLIYYPPGGGSAGLTEAGMAVAVADNQGNARDAMLGVLEPRQLKIVRALLETNASCLSREALANVTEYSDKSSGFEKTLGNLSALGIAKYPMPGHVALEDWARDLLS